MDNTPITYGELVAQTIQELRAAGGNKEAHDQCIGKLNLIYANIVGQGKIMSGSGTMKEFAGVDKDAHSSGTTQEWTHSFASPTNRYFFTPSAIQTAEDTFKTLHLEDKSIPPEKAAEIFIKAASKEAQKSHDSMKKILEQQRQKKGGGIPAPLPQSGQLQPSDISGGEDVAVASLSRSFPASSSGGRDIS